MSNYYRITAYSKEDDYTMIIDSFGKFEKLWQFSADLIQKGFSILEASKEEKMLDVNIDKLTEETDNYILRAMVDGKPEYIAQEINSITYKAIKVGVKIYVPNKEILA